MQEWAMPKIHQRKTLEGITILSSRHSLRCIHIGLCIHMDGNIPRLVRQGQLDLAVGALVLEVPKAE
jgi:hypothetical protein